jgi:hypothetical protein
MMIKDTEKNCRMSALLPNTGASDRCRSYGHAYLRAWLVVEQKVGT